MVYTSNLSSFPEKYVGNQFEIDCVEIEVLGFDDNQPPIFKGPGFIRGDKDGQFSYKIYNQITVNKEICDYIRGIKEDGDPKEINIRLNAKAYDGTKWGGSWSIPKIEINAIPYLLINGELDQLSTRVSKQKGNKIEDYTELIYSDDLAIPLVRKGEIKNLDGGDITLNSYQGDHYNVNFEGSNTISEKCG